MPRTGLPQLSRPLVLLGILGLAGAVGSASARAQFSPSIPYTPYTSQYQSFSYPTIVNPALPNQSRLMYGTTTGQYSTFSLDGALGDGSGRFARAGSNNANAKPLSSYAEAQAKFAENQARRDALYLQIVQEPDAEKRSALQKELREVEEALSKNLGIAQRRTGLGKGRKQANVTPATTIDPPRRGGGTLMRARRAATNRAGEAPAVPDTMLEDDDLETVPGSEPLETRPGPGESDLRLPGSTDLPALDLPLGSSSSGRSSLRSSAARRPGLGDLSGSSIRGRSTSYSSSGLSSSGLRRISPPRSEFDPASLPSNRTLPSTAPVAPAATLP